MSRHAPAAGVAIGLCIAMLGCKQPDQDLVSRGRRVYMTTCTNCHNSDPHKPGNVGPEIAGSSRDLVRARVLRGEYPPGYPPKRSTKLMIPSPHLEPDVDALTEFLNQ